MQRWVALKVLHVDHLDERARQAFRRECELMGRLSAHPHVVTLYKADIAPDQRPYLITEFCPGGSLEDALTARGPLPPGEVHDIALQLTDALVAAHGHGVVHRDVKPANALITTFGKVALTDFGLSVAPGPGAADGLDAYTAEHAAPEVLGDGHISPAGDLYALGSTLYALLMGASPFPRRPREDPMAHLLRVRRDAPQPLPGVPTRLAEVVLHLLAKEPSARPATAAETRRLLSEAASGQAEVGAGGTWRPPGSGASGSRREIEGSGGPGGRDGQPPELPWGRGPVGATTTREVPLDPPEPPPPPPRRPSRGVVISAACAVVVAAVVVALLLLRDDVPPLPPEGPPITLEEPVDRGSSVTLRWSGPEGLTYVVFYDSVDDELQTTSAGTASTLDLEVTPDTPYCLEVRGSDGTKVFESNRVSLRADVC